MNPIKMASPLYIVREQCEKDLYATLQKLKDIGFEGIEFLGFFGHDAQEVRTWMDKIGLTALGNHVPFATLVNDTDAILDFHQQVGCEYLTIADLPTSDLAATATALDEIAAASKLRGIRLLYHNHDNELIDKVEGVELLSAILDNTCADTLAFEPDLGWIEIGGGDCAHYLRKYVSRCPVIHLKDYYASERTNLGRVREFLPARGGADRGHFEFRPTGYGVLNMPALMPLCLACAPQWFVMDHDLAYGRDSFDDLRLCLEYTKNLLSMCIS